MWDFFFPQHTARFFDLERDTSGLNLDKQECVELAYCPTHTLYMAVLHLINIEFSITSSCNVRRAVFVVLIYNYNKVYLF